MKSIWLFFFCLIGFALLACGGGDSSDDPQEGTLGIVFPPQDAIIGTFPTTFKVLTGGSANYQTFNAELDDGSGIPKDITSKFSRQPNRAMQAWYSSLSPGSYRLDTRIGDALGQTISDSVQFTVPSKPDLTVPPGITKPRPRPPKVGNPIDMKFPVRNQGTVDSGETTLVVICIPKLGGDPIFLGSIPIPALEPGEEFPVELDLPAPSEPCTLRTGIDPQDLVDESDEDNNSTEEEVEPPPVSDIDLAVHIEALGSLVTEQTVQGAPKIRFQVQVSNIGERDIQFPKLRFSLKDRDSGNYLGGSFGALPGGGPGACSSGGLSNDPARVLSPLAVGQRALLEIETGWHSNFTSGRIELCVEVIADSDGDAKTWTAQTEADGHTNNAAKAEWDMNLLGDFPVTGEITVTRIEIFDAGDQHPAGGGLPLDHGDGTKTLRLYLNSLSSSGANGLNGLISVGTTFTARGGKDDGHTMSSDWRLHQIIYPNSYVEIPLPHRGPLPGAPFIELVITATAGCETLNLPFRACTDGDDGPVVGSHTISLPVNYKDVRVTSIRLSPDSPDAHTVPSGSDPILAIARIDNLGMLQTTVDVGMRVTIAPSAQGSDAELGPLSSSPQQNITVPGNGFVEVDFPWSPATPSMAGNDLDRYQLTAEVIPLENQWPGSSGDNQDAEFFSITQVPDLTVVSVNPKRVIYNPNKPINLRINVYDHHFAPSTTFSVEVINKHPDGDVVVSPATTNSLSSRYDTVSANVSLTAGYHNLEIRLNNTPIFTHPIDVAPRLNFAGVDWGPVYENGRTHWARDINGHLKLFTMSDQVITAVSSEGDVGFDVGQIAGIYKRTFTVDDGTSGNDTYLVVMRTPVRFVGVMQTADLAFGISDFRAGVAVGLRTVDLASPVHCWFCTDNLVRQKTIWESPPDSLLPIIPDFVLQKVGEEVVTRGLELKVQRALTKKSVTRAGVFAGKAAQRLSTALDLLLFTWGATTCDDDIFAYEKVDFEVPVVNGETYDLYFLLGAQSRSWAIFGDTWSYVDFYDYYTTDCGGFREGILLEQPTEYWLH